MNLNFVIAQFHAQNVDKLEVVSSSQYLWKVYVPVMIWLLIVLAFIILMFAKFTFGNWTKDHPNPHNGETFDMPRGVFRGILTLTLLFVAVIFELVTVHTPYFEDHIKEFLVAFQMMIAFYFGSKVMHHVTSVDKHKTKIAHEEATKREIAVASIDETVPDEELEDEFMPDLADEDEEVVG